MSGQMRQPNKQKGRGWLGGRAVGLWRGLLVGGLRTEAEKQAHGKDSLAEEAGLQNRQVDQGLGTVGLTRQYACEHVEEKANKRVNEMGRQTEDTGR